MDYRDILSNQFEISYEEERDAVIIKYFNDGGVCVRPIVIKMETLEEIGEEKASQFLGERVLLLIPAARKRIFAIED